ncbi:hypothetical protein [Enterococcus sp. DIV0800]
MNVDAEKVIQNLVARIATLELDNATLKAAIENTQNENNEEENVE